MREDVLGDLRLDLHTTDIIAMVQAVHVNLVVEVPDVAQQRVVLHLLHVLESNDVLVACGGDDNVDICDDALSSDNVETVHQCLQCVNRVGLGDLNASALASQCLCASLTHVTVATDQYVLAANQHVGTAVDAVQKAVPGAVLVIELGLGDRIVDVHGREWQHSLLCEVVEAVDTSGGLLCDTLDRLCNSVPTAGILLQAGAKHVLEGNKLIRIRLFCRRHQASILEFHALNDSHGGVAAVVQNHVGIFIAPVEDAVEAPPVLFQCLALPSENRNTLRILRSAVSPNDDCRSGLILSGEDVARGPADLCAQRRQGLDEHCGLNRHVNGAGNTGTGQWLLLCVLFAQRH